MGAEAFDHQLSNSELYADLTDFGEKRISDKAVEDESSKSNSAKISETLYWLFFDSKIDGQAPKWKHTVEHYGLKRAGLWKLLIDARHRKTEHGRYYVLISLAEAAT